MLHGFRSQTATELIKETEKFIRQVIRLLGQLSAENNAKRTVLHQLLGRWSAAISSSVVTGNVVFKAATHIPLPKGPLSQIYTRDDPVRE